LKVPEQVAVISTGNDALLCELSTPPLSGIDQDTPRIGYEAAALLDRLMRGEPPPAQPIRIQPKGLVARGSTDLIAFPDRDVAAALRLIRDRACEGLRVYDVADACDVSYSLLERKFRRFLGRTPKAELLQVQIERARQLLVDSDLPLQEVAQRCGFSNEKYFGDAFFRLTGLRAGVYRRQRRLTTRPGR
jgi:LacI family transcriptional regulator